MLRFVLAGFAIEALFVKTRLLGDLSTQVVETAALGLAINLFYIVCVWLVLRLKDQRTGALTAVILGAAIVFRLTAWGLFPALSEDPYRYRWEGMLQAHGGNPYQVRPNDPAWSELRDATFEHIPARDFKAGYGPLTELVEYWTYSLLSRAVADPFGQVFWFKLPYAICDAGIIAALLGLLQAMRRPSHHILIYAWSPLPVMEFWATGHNDSMMLLGIVLALWAAARERWVSAFFCLSLAAAAKLWPLALFPVFAGWKGRRPARWWQWTIALPVFGAFAWPYRGPIVENIQHVSGFLGGWRNHDSLFGLLLWLAGDQYAAKYAAFAILAAVVLLVMLLRLPLERATLIVITAMLMVSSNCHPWYLTWMMPFLALWPVPALLLWTTLAPMAYAVLIDWRLLGEWHGSTPARLWTYIPVYGLLLGTAGAALARKLKGAPAGGKLSRNISRTSESSS